MATKPKFQYTIWGSGLLLASSQIAFGEVIEELNKRYSDPVLTAVHSDELRLIMRRLNTLAYEREYTELQLQKLRTAQITLLVNTVVELIDTIDELPEVISATSLGEADRITFRALARRLLEETLSMRAHVRDGDEEALDDGYRRLQETCAACHRLFRGR
jgi:hypothetical protein